jgi:hypothetical protein
VVFGALELLLAHAVNAMAEMPAANSATACFVRS